MSGMMCLVSILFSFYSASKLLTTNDTFLLRPVLSLNKTKVGNSQDIVIVFFLILLSHQHLHSSDMFLTARKNSIMMLDELMKLTSTI